MCKRCDQWVLAPTGRYKLIGGVSRRRSLRLIDDPTTGKLQLYYGAPDSCGADLLAHSLTIPIPLVQGEGIAPFGVNEVAGAGAGNPGREQQVNGGSRQ